MALKTVVAPKRIQMALIEVLPSLYQFLQKNPQVGVHHHAVYKPQVKLWLPVYVGHALASSMPKKKGASTRQRLTAKRVAWVCFLQTNKGVNAAIELQAEKSGIRHQFQHGEFIQRTYSRMKSATRSQRLRRTPYRARLLNVPGLYFSALWFKSGSRDLFVSLVRVGDGKIKAGGFYSRSEIVRALTDEVLKRKEAHQVVLARKHAVSRAALLSTDDLRH